MKNIYLTLIFSYTYLIFGLTPSFSQETSLVASCCEEEAGRCTGSSYCTACKNCRYCKHCNSGGSCGVCSGGSRRTTTPTYTPKRTTYPSTSRNTTTTTRSNTKNSIWNNDDATSKSDLYNLPNDIYSEYYLKTLMVNTISLNLRAGPGTEYIILEELNKYQELIFLAMTGDWVKVKVKSTDTIGFVHYKYIVVLNK